MQDLFFLGNVSIDYGLRVLHKREAALNCAGHCYIMVVVHLKKKRFLKNNFVAVSSNQLAIRYELFIIMWLSFFLHFLKIST